MTRAIDSLLALLSHADSGTSRLGLATRPATLYERGEEFRHERNVEVHEEKYFRGVDPIRSRA
jgi:hypothetical protein